MADNFIKIPVSPSNLDRWIVRSSILGEIKSVLPRLKGRVLDVGCGRMPYKKLIIENRHVSSYVGLDIDSGLSYDDNIKPDILWDGKTMPIPKGSFDCVIATEVLEHAPDIPALLGEIHRVLLPGGIMFFTTPFLWPYHETPNDRQRWTSYGLRYHFEKAGFHAIDIRSVGNWHSSLAQMLGLWGARAPMNRLLRKLVRYPIFILQRVLFALDSVSSEKENAMPRMIVGTAIS